MDVALGFGADMTPLMLAAADGNVGGVAKLLGADDNDETWQKAVDTTALHACARNGWTALMYAAAADNADVVRLLVSAGARVDAVSKDFGTALSIACLCGCRSAVVALLEAGANVDSEDMAGKTPLMHAAEKGWQAIAQDLLAGGASTTAVSTNALEWALQSGNDKTAAVIVHHGAELTSLSRLRVPWLHLAAMNGCADTLAAIVARGVAVDLWQQEHRTALMSAARAKHAHCVQVLMRCGADVHARSTAGFTSLAYAARLGHVPTMQALLAAGADPNAIGLRYATTVLMQGVQSGSCDAVAMLVAAGAAVPGPRSRNVHLTAEELASASGFPPVAALLRAYRLQNNAWLRRRALTCLNELRSQGRCRHAACL